MSAVAVLALTICALSGVILVSDNSDAAELSVPGKINSTSSTSPSDGLSGVLYANGAVYGDADFARELTYYVAVGSTVNLAVIGTVSLYVPTSTDSSIDYEIADYGYGDDP